MLSDDDFEAGVDQAFTTVLSTGEEVPICPDGENKKVTKSNIDEFCTLVLKARANEATEQVKAIRSGFLQVIENRVDILNFCDWQTLEARCTGEKTVNIERFKKITSYPYCNDDHPIVGRFWRVFESMDDEHRALYLRFVWGRCRIPIDVSNLDNKH